MTVPFRIETKPAFNVLGYLINTTNQKKAARKDIPQHWEKFKQNDLQNILLPLMNQNPLGLFGLNIYNTDEQDARKFNYMIAVSSNHDNNETLSTYTVPETTWAIFPCTIETIAKTEVMAISKWLPKSSYRPLNSGYITGRMKSQAPDIEYYGNDGQVEVWIAVKEK